MKDHSMWQRRKLFVSKVYLSQINAAHKFTSANLTRNASAAHAVL